MRRSSFSLPLALAVLLSLGAAELVSYLAVPAPIVAAAVQHVSADGSYTMGDGLEESPHVAKIRARQDALRMASEQAGLYVESQTKVVNSVLTEDEIRTLASTVLQVTKETYAFDDMGGQGMKIICHIEADVDSVKIDEVLKQRREDAEKWAQMQAQAKALREHVAKLQQENEALKAAYANAQTEQEKQKIQNEAKKNQEGITAADWFERGLKAQKAKQYEEAVRDYNEALRLDPQYVYAYNNRGAAYDDLKQYKKAIEDYNEALRLDPKDAAAYNNRGIAYKALKQYERAIEDYTEAIRLNPNDAALYYYSRGGCYFYLKDYANAYRDAKRANQLQAGKADDLLDALREHGY